MLDRETLLEELRRLEAELGYTPTRRDMNEHGQYSQQPYYRAFDGWTAALEAAGLDPDEGPGPSTLDDDELLEALREVADELGRPPSTTDMQDHGEFSHRPYYRAFGDWPSALEAAGLDDD